MQHESSALRAESASQAMQDHAIAVLLQLRETNPNGSASRRRSTVWRASALDQRMIFCGRKWPD